MISNEFKKIFNSSISPEGKYLVFDFFITFSRFECVLKNSITFANSNNSKVTANWERFTSSISETFNRVNTEELNIAVEYLLTNPPKVQYLENNKLVWRDRIVKVNMPITTQLGLHIRTIRNNLFHGGKFKGVYQQDISRNHTLLRSAMIILNEWLSLDENIKSLFLERIS